MNKFVSKSRYSLRTLAPAIALLALTACQHEMSGAIDDVYMPQMHYEVHPIEVAKGTVKLQVPTRSSKLTNKEQNAIRSFAHQANETEAAQVHIQRPAGAMVGNAVAAKVAQLLEREGVSSYRIKHTSYKASAGSPVVMTFTRKFAVTSECGDWNDNLSETYSNQNYKNFGCSQQHNLAAMVANPEDFETPRVSTSASASRRNEIFKKYVGGEDTTAAQATQAQASASDAGGGN